MHYAHTDGGVSAIRCLDQSVDEPPDFPARAPRVSVFAARCQSLCCQNTRLSPLRPSPSLLAPLG